MIVYKDEWISDEWFGYGDERHTALIECLLDDGQIECSPDLSRLLKIYPVNRSYPHSRWYSSHYNYGATDNYDAGYEDQLPIFWLLDRHLNGPPYMRNPIWKTTAWLHQRVQILLDHRVEFNVMYHSVTPLYIAMIRVKSCPLANIMIEHGADINFGGDSCPILCDCIKDLGGCYEVLSYSLQKGIDPNQFDRDGVTALILAIKDHQHDTVCALLEYGADPLMRSISTDWSRWQYNDSSISPLEMACESGFADGVLACLWYIDACDRTPELLRRPIMLACAWGHLICLDVCLWGCCSMNLTDEEATELLHCGLYVACESSQVDIIMYLIKRIMA